MLRYALVRTSGITPLLDPASPQFQAHSWLVNDDDLYICPNSKNLQQRYILAVIFYATDGMGWNQCFRGDHNCRSETGQEPYLSNSSECDWFGSKCNSDGMITEVDLEDNNLIDNVPLEVTQLPQLRDLILANNDLEGNFPAVNFTSTNINIIDLEKNMLEGAIPTNMFGLRDLKTLKLNSNRFAGTMPSQICDLRNESLEALWSDCSTPPDPPLIDCPIDTCCTQCFAGA